VKLIVGLGNPGNNYVNTRHNIGFMFVDNYLKYKNIDDNWSSKFNGLYVKTVINKENVIFLKPQTFMNLSGDCVKKFVDYFNINVEDVLVISDDLDLNIGNFKLKLNGSCGGHNGLRDIELKLSVSNFKRLRIGISKNNAVDTRDYVLGYFSKEEMKIIFNLFNELFLVVDKYFELPFGDLMSLYNRKNR